MMKDHYPFSQFLGVDVSKATLDFAFADATKRSSPTTSVIEHRAMAQKIPAWSDERLERQPRTRHEKGIQNVF